MEVSLVNGMINGHEKPMDTGAMEILTLKEELERINAEFIQANEERAQAAEYGLALLEEKQSLQSEFDEIAQLYDISKQELDKSLMTLRQVQQDYEKRVHDVEQQREYLVKEMELREDELLGKVGQLEEERRQLERRLKKCSTDRDHMSDVNSILSTENDRLKAEVTVQKEELRRLKREDSHSQSEIEQLRSDIDHLQTHLDRLVGCEKECSSLAEQNRSLQQHLETLQTHYESVLTEKDELENQTQQVIEALNEEREAKGLLEQKLHEGLRRSPNKVALLAESRNTSEQAVVGQSSAPQQSASVPSSPTGPPNNQSTPFLPKPATSLLSELQNSLVSASNTQVSELEMELSSLQQKHREAEANLQRLTLENSQLQREVQTCRSSAVELERLRKSQLHVEDQEKEVAGLKEEVATMQQLIGQLKSNLSKSNGEKASQEIELEGLRDEMQRARQTFKADVEKLEKEIADEQGQSESLRKRIAGLEGQLQQSVNTSEKLESILVSSNTELSVLTRDMLSLHRAISSLRAESKLPTPPPTQPDSAPREESMETGDGESETYSVVVQGGRQKLDVHRESHVLLPVVNLREHMRLTRKPLEQFTRTMLKRLSSQRMVAESGAGEENDSKSKKVAELEGNISKLNARLANRAEEVIQLRTILKARQTTQEVTINSLKSKILGQVRAHETESNQLKHKIKMLRKERDDQTSLCAMTSRRCQEYLEEVGRVKKKVEELRRECHQLQSENKLLDVYLERTIKQKLEISQKLESYQEQEERTQAIPLNISATRV